MALRLVQRTCAELQLCERGHRVGGADVASELESEPERLLEALRGAFVVAEEELDAAEVVEQLVDAQTVAAPLVELERLLPVAAGHQPLAFALGDDRRLEVEPGRDVLV